MYLFIYFAQLVCPFIYYIFFFLILFYNLNSDNNNKQQTSVAGTQIIYL